MCREKIDRVDSAVLNPEFRHLRDEAARDSDVKPILGDWLEEHLGGRGGL